MGSDGAIINFGEHSDIVLTHVADTGLLLSSVTTGNLLHLKSTEADASTTASPILVIERDSASPADDDYCGMIQFKADSDTGVSRSIARIQTQLKDVSNGTEDSEVILTNMIAGTETSQIILGTGITFGTAITASSTLTVNAGINIDDFNIDGTTIALSAGNMTLDGAVDIVLDAAGDHVIFKDGSTNVGHIDMTSDNLTIKSLEANKSIIFKGDDAGSEVTALTLDMAEAGDASFGRNVTIGGNLTVSGTTTTINSTVTTLQDPIITLGKSDTDDNKDRGIEFKYNDGSARVGFFGYDDSEAKFTLLTAATNSSEVFSGTTGTLVANLEGNVSGATTVTGTTLIGKLKKTASDTEFTLPASDGSANEFLKTDGSGNLGFSAVTVNNSGFDASGSEQLTVSKGGTGATSFTNNRVLTGNGTSAISDEANLTFDGSTLTVAGAITASGNITGLTSDKRLKDFKETIPSALEKVSKLNGYNFNWNDTAKKLDANIFDDEDQVGVSAQEVLEVCPEAVKPAPIDNNYYTVQYEKLVPLLIEAIKDLKQELDEHKHGCNCK